MAKFSFSIKKLIMIIINPLIKSLMTIKSQAENTFDTRTIQLTGDVTGSGRIIGKDLPNIIEINTTVNPTSHVHTVEQLPTSISPVANTIVLRDNSGRIYSKGTNDTDTGYKITGVGDISSLFEKMSQPYMTVTYNKSGSGALSNAWLSMDGKNLQLNTQFSNWCSYRDNCECQCCD